MSCATRVAADLLMNAKFGSLAEHGVELMDKLKQAEFDTKQEEEAQGQLAALQAAIATLRPGLLPRLASAHAAEQPASSRRVVFAGSWCSCLSRRGPPCR